MKIFEVEKTWITEIAHIDEFMPLNKKYKLLVELTGGTMTIYRTTTGDYYIDCHYYNRISGSIDPQRVEIEKDDMEEFLTRNGIPV